MSFSPEIVLWCSPEIVLWSFVPLRCVPLRYVPFFSNLAKRCVALRCVSIQRGAKESKAKQYLAAPRHKEPCHAWNGRRTLPASTQNERTHTSLHASRYKFHGMECILHCIALQLHCNEMYWYRNSIATDWIGARINQNNYYVRYKHSIIYYTTTCHMPHQAFGRSPLQTYRTVRYRA